MNVPATPLAAALFALLLGATSPVLANNEEQQTEETAPVKELPSIEEFLSFQEELRKDLEAGEYGEFSDQDMELIDKSQAKLKELLSGVEDPADLRMEERIEAYNAQEAIKAVLSENVKARPLCRRERSVGSHMSKTVCYTPREKSVMEEAAQDVYRNMGWTLPSGG